MRALLSSGLGVLVATALAWGTDTSPAGAQSANQALRLDGSGAHLDIPYKRSLALERDSFTIEMWFYLDRIRRGAQNQLLANDEYELYVMGGLGLGTWGHGTELRGEHRLAPGAWHHVAFIKDRQRQHLLLDGVPDSPTDMAGDGQDRQQNLWIGNDPSETDRPFQGMIDEVRIWRRALSDEEVIAGMNRSQPDSAAGLVLRYSFDGLDANGRVPDLSGNNHPAKLAQGAELAPSTAPLDLGASGPELTVSPGEIRAGAIPHLAFLAVGNTGTGVLHWTVASPVPWLRVASFSGSAEGSTPIAGTGSDLLAVYTSGRELAPGPLDARLIITSDSGERQIPVHLERQAGFPVAHPRATGPGQCLALSFDNSLEPLAGTPLAGLTRFTIECWVQRTHGTGEGPVLCMTDSVSERFRLTRDDDHWRWQVNRASLLKSPFAEAVFTTAMLPGSFQHVAVVQAGDTCRVYVDGVLAGERTGMALHWHDPRYQLWVGNYRHDQGNYFGGLMDELRIWDEARTQVQLRESMNRSLQGDEDHLINYWRFDEADATGQIADLSGSGQSVQLPRLVPLRASAAPIGNVTPPRLETAPAAVEATSGDEAWHGIDLANTGAGVLSWTVRTESASWVGLSRVEGGALEDTLSGEGPVRLFVRTVGRGLPAGQYQSHVFVETNGGSAQVPVSMQVGAEPELDPTEARVSADEVPEQVWSWPYAMPVGKALDRPLSAVGDQLRQEYGLVLQDFRLVAVTSEGGLYAAAETPFQNSQGRLALETRVWTSRDRGATWRLLLHLVPQAYCSYSVSLRAAALHPDGHHVFLGTSNGLFLDGAPVATPPQAAGISALHVSPDGRYLVVATQDLSTTCEWPTYVLSVAGLYRARLGDQLTWDDLTTPLVGFVAPLAAVGSDPGNPDQVFLRCASGAMFHRRVLSAADYGWETVSASKLPAYLSFETALPAAEPFLRVQEGYPGGWTPNDLDIHWSWGGFLFGRDGLAYAQYRGLFSHMNSFQVIGSRDAGVSWRGVWGYSDFGWGSSDLEPVALLLDARGLVAATGSIMTGFRAETVGPWAVDPIDPLTAYVAMRGRGLVYRTRDSGAHWARLGQGLAPTLVVTGLAVDSLGVLYLRSGQEVFVRRGAVHDFRMTEAQVTPALLHRGEVAQITARLPWPPPSGRSFQVQVQTEPDTAWMALRDDGTPPDRVAADGIWSGSFIVPPDRPFGYYGAIVVAQGSNELSTRASQRAVYQVAPSEDVTIFAEGPGVGWQCDSSLGSSDLAAGDHVHDGSLALHLAGEVTCTYNGEPLHPFDRTLELWAYSEGGVGALQINDTAADSDPSLPSGQWVHLSIPAERLNAQPLRGFAGSAVRPALLTALRFRAASAVWLDQIELRATRPEPPTAVEETYSPALPLATKLLPAYPNPFNAQVRIPYELAQGGAVRLRIFNILGQPVRILVDEAQVPGAYAVVWDGRGEAGRELATGLYLCRLQVEGQFWETHKLLLLR